MFDDTGEPALSDVSQYRIFTGEIPEECRLADLENVDNIVNAGVLVTLLAEKSDGSFDNLLAQSSLLAFPKAKYLVPGS